MCNDPDGVLMSFPKLTPKEILKVLKVTNNRINREMGRQIIVDDVYKADADKVLDFLITVSCYCGFAKKKPVILMETVLTSLLLERDRKCDARRKTSLYC